MKCPYCSAELNETARFCYACGRPMPQSSARAEAAPPPASGGSLNPPAKPKKKRSAVVILSVIAGILILGVAAALFFLLFRSAGSKVSAEELAIAKENYSPPAQVYEIDPAADDPSSDQVTFRYDERDRIIYCSYTINDRQYEQDYTYDDSAKAVEIVTTYKNNPIASATVSYDDVEYYGAVEVVDGYYIRLDQDSSDSLQRAKTGYVFHRTLLDYNGVVYYTDQSGLWMNDGSTSTRLYQCNANHLATDGKTVYFSVFNQEKSGYSTRARTTLKWNQFDLYSYDIRSGDCEKILSFNENGQPLCRIGDTVYFTDYKDDFDGFAVELSPSLYAYDLTTGEKTLLVEDEALAVCIYGHKIFLTRITGALMSNMANFKCYDIDENELTTVSDQTVTNQSVIGDSLFYTVYSYDFDSKKEQNTVYRRDLITGEDAELLDESSQYNRISYLDEEYIVYAGGSRYDNLTYYLYHIREDSTTAISALSSVKSYVSFYRDGDQFVCENGDELLIFPIDGSAAARSIPTNDDNNIIAICHNNAYYYSSNNYYFYTIYAVPIGTQETPDPTAPARDRN